MKRDWDVMRKIMLEVDRLELSDGQLTSNDVSGVPREIAAYHMTLLIEGYLAEGGTREESPVGLIPQPFLTRTIPPMFMVRLTRDGCTLLNEIRRNQTWSAIKRLARVKGVPLSRVEIEGAAAAIKLRRK